VKNFEVARQFELMADILELKGENVFRIRAYRRAAQNLGSLSEDVETVAREDRLEDIPGIGADLAGKIMEYLRTGKIREIRAASKGIPRGVVALLNIPGVGPRTARVLYEREHITGIDQLEKRARKGGLRGLPGIQAKTEQNILKGIRLVRGGQARMPLGRALPIGRELVHALEGLAAVERISLAGSIRRMKETVGDIDILVTSSKPAAVMRAFVSLPQAAEVLERGTTKGSIRHREGIQVDLRVVDPACFGAALVYFTGSKQHNIHIRDIGVKKGLKISEYGVFRAATGRRLVSATEAEVYAAVELPWIPPELREDAGEIEAALQGKLPHLVELDDIRGDLHCHTTLSDGHNTLEEMAEAARERGYSYLAVTDHSATHGFGNDVQPDALRARIEEVRKLDKRLRGFKLLAGTETNILPDGSLDYDDELLGELDWVVASVHTSFRISERAMTERVVAAIEHPLVDCIGHLTGRMLLRRRPYDIDVERVAEAAASAGTMLEINGNPNRRDLSEHNARLAAEIGATIVINTDAHRVRTMENMRYGVATARRAWLTADQIANTRPWRSFSRLRKRAKHQRIT
jgi:DNA polymerase (family 10)